MQEKEGKCSSQNGLKNIHLDQPYELCHSEFAEISAPYTLIKTFRLMQLTYRSLSMDKPYTRIKRVKKTQKFKYTAYKTCYAKLQTKSHELKVLAKHDLVEILLCSHDPKVKMRWYDP